MPLGISQIASPIQKGISRHGDPLVSQVSLEVIVSAWFISPSGGFINSLQSAAAAVVDGRAEIVTESPSKTFGHDVVQDRVDCAIDVK